MSEETVQVYGYNTATRNSNGAVKSIGIHEGCPDGWTFQAPPSDVPERHVAYYFGPNWILSDGYGCEKIEPPPQSEPKVI